MPSVPKIFLERLAQEHNLTEFEQETFIARMSDIKKTDIVVARELNISRDRYSTRMTKVYSKFNINGSGPNKSYLLFLKLLDLQENKFAYSNLEFSEENLAFVVEEANRKLKYLIQYRCGSIRVLDMSYPIDISQIYTEVNILNRVVSKRYIGISDFLENFNFKLYNSLSSSMNSELKRFSALEYVKKHKKLVLLGKPGSGKTTFLKKLCISCNKQESFLGFVPFFISFRYFSENIDGLSIFDYLVEEYKDCNNLSESEENYEQLSLSKEEVKRLLRNGRVLCLFDGLDEVRDSQKDYVFKELQFFLRNYSNNRFIITCRIASQEYMFDGFSEIEISDFNDDQIKQFAKNWFTSVSDHGGELDLSQAFIKRLERDDRVHELATNPLLLTLLCLVFNDSRGFPSNRAELYEEGLDILLKKWDARRNIERAQAYQRLSRQRKENLLSHIAYMTFNHSQYFFKQRMVEMYIRDYITNLPGASDDLGILDLDSRAILKSIEAQHGLLIERAKGIYSFSHLTFHEYFTARNIVGNFDPNSKEAAISALVSHISDPRWREIILLTVGMSTNTDYFLYRIKEGVNNILSDEGLEPFIEWLRHHLVTIDNSSSNLATNRLFYFCLGCIELELQILNYGTNTNLKIDHDLIFCLNLANATRSNLEQSSSLTSVTLSRESGRKLKESCTMLSRTLDKTIQDAAESELSNCLKRHAGKLPILEGNIREWWRGKSKEWIADFRDILIKHRDIGHDWKFTLEQSIQIKQYYEANKLLYDCLMSDCYVSKEFRQSLLNDWLIPSLDKKASA